MKLTRRSSSMECGDLSPLWFGAERRADFSTHAASPPTNGSPEGTSLRQHLDRRLGGDKSPHSIGTARLRNRNQHGSVLIVTLWASIGLVKRLLFRDELIDPQDLRIISERFRVIGRMASPDWYCRTTDRFEMLRPK